MATHSSSLAWRILIGRGIWWATVHSVSQSWTQLKRLSTHARIKEGAGQNKHWSQTGNAGGLAIFVRHLDSFSEVIF